MEEMGKKIGRKNSRRRRLSPSRSRWVPTWRNSFLGFSRGKTWRIEKKSGELKWFFEKCWQNADKMLWWLMIIEKNGRFQYIVGDVRCMDTVVSGYLRMFFVVKAPGNTRHMIPETSPEWLFVARNPERCAPEGIVVVQKVLRLIGCSRSIQYRTTIHLTQMNTE